MSDIKISQLPRTSTISPGDLLLVVSNPGTSPVTQSLSACKALPIIGGTGTGSAISLLGGNSITGSNCSIAIGGIGNTISGGSDRSSAIGGSLNALSSTATDSVIIGGCSNTSSAYITAIINGCGNKITSNSPFSTTIGGISNCLDSFQGNIIGGCNNYSTSSNYSGIFNSTTSCINLGNWSSIFNGYNNCIYNNSNSTILNGNWNTISTGSTSTILNGNLNTIKAGQCNFIAYGFKNCIIAVNGVSILGTALTATQSNTLYTHNVVLSAFTNEFGSNQGTPLAYTLNVSPLTIVAAASGSVFESLQNTYASVSASTDISVYNDTANYLDMGIASSVYNGNLYGPKFNVVGAGDSYLYTTANDLVIGTSSPSISSDIVFFTGGTLSGTSVNSGNERFRITNTAGTYSGNVGVNTATPNQQLTVSGSISSTAMVYASTFSVGLTASGAVGGSNFGKFPIYSSTGVLLGYVPIYQS